MSLRDIDFYYYNEGEVRNTQRVYEPLGMLRDELIQWYMEQPKPFRKRHSQRIAELSMQMTMEETASVLEQLFGCTDEAGVIQ